jgi:hypothetical protein
MTDPPRHGGDIIAYLDTSELGRGEIRRALLTDIGIVDPETGVTWAAVVTANHGLTLLDPGQIVDSGRAAAEASPAVVDVLAGALAVLAGDLIELDELDEPTPGPQPDPGALVSRFVAVLTPIERSLSVLAERDPSGPLSTVLRCVGCAVEHFARGRFTEGRAGILIAHAITSDLIEPGP